MYTLSVSRKFSAQHFLIGGDWGKENELHTHHYKVEVQLQGDELDQHGYLIDLLDLDHKLDDLAAHYRAAVLNELPEFKGLNPSIEHFSRILWEVLEKEIAAPNVKFMAVKLWENNIAWVSYHRNL
ncbi:MAG: 6-pyruvoyl trahydropterin synthase family protein [Anaerolineales bacterium]